MESENANVGFSPGSTLINLCDFRQVTSLLWASVFSPIPLEDYHIKEDGSPHPAFQEVKEGGLSSHGSDDVMTSNSPLIMLNTRIRLC